MTARCRARRGRTKKFNLEDHLIEDEPDLINFPDLGSKNTVIEPIPVLIDRKGVFIDQFLKSGKSLGDS